MKKWLALLLTLLFLLPIAAHAENETVYTLVDEQGNAIASICHECDVGDEYFSADNQHYRVVKVDKGSAQAQVEALGAFELPDVSWLDADGTMPVSATGRTHKIAMYSTHSDESYEKGDGKSSIETRGGIYDVADKLKAVLTEQGAEVLFSENTHHPHDAGAYRRSRQTAVELLKSQPDAIFDIHRDGIPDPDEYAVTIGDQKVSKIRLLVGKGNQNKDANLSLAKQIKAVGDKVYPKLIKDIYMGKGSYNQDLSPRSVLLECGTHTLSKDRVLATMPMLGDVLYRTLYGGVIGSAGASDVKSGTTNNMDEKAAASQEDNKAAGGGIIWMIVALVAGLLIFGFLASGSGKGGWRKFGRSVSEMTGGLVGKKPKDE